MGVYLLVSILSLFLGNTTPQLSIIFHPTPFNGNTQSVTPKVNEGDILFFPSTYIHSSTTNTSVHDRAIVAWNMRLNDYCDSHSDTLDDLY